MVDGQRIVVGHKELAEILVKQQGIHEGLWGLFIRFGFNAVNMPFQLPEGSRIALVPTAVVPLLEIGIQPFSELNDLCVDATVVNPRPKQSRKVRAKKTGRKKK